MQTENERDERVMTLVEAALARVPEDREAYLRAACGGDAEVYAEVTERLEWEQRMSGFLSQSLITSFEFLDRPFEPGETVAGRFRIIGEAGRGGMGVVYEAFDEKLSRRVAIKCGRGGCGHGLPPEVLAAREVSHYNVCKVHDLHSTTTELGEVEFLTMEYIEGETLSERIRRAGALAPADAREIARQICAGLAQAHRQGVIHGDLKCSNIILSETRAGATRAVITDFGLAAMKLAGEERRLHEPAGSLDYMAPELIAGEAVSVASDLYALGVIFHFMLTAEAPGPTPTARIRPSSQTLTMDHPALGQYVPRRPGALPAMWSPIVSRCLDPEPEKRFGSAEAIAERLKERNSVRNWMLAAAAAVILAIGLWQGYATYVRQRPAAPPRSVAVIPFVNAIGTPENEYLADGISEGLIHALAELPDVKVIARSSSFRFRGDRLDIPSTARALGVRTLVTGRITETGGHFRITAELVNGADGTELWGAQYNAAMADLAGTQTEISQRIAEQVGSRLSPAERSRLARGASANPEAYGLLLRGRYNMGLYTPDSRKKAVDYYEQALAIDPGFALANAELASAYRILSGSGLQAGAEAMPKAEAAARRALAADGSLAEGHAALADIEKDEWKFAEAEREYRRALDLNPNLVAAHEGLAINLSVLGRYDAAIQEAQRAVELDPVGLEAAIDTAAVYYNARRFDGALDALRRAAHLDPAAPSPQSWIGIVHGGKGQFPEAIAAYEESMRLGDHTAATQCYYAYALARSGRREQARQILQRLKESAEFVPSSSLAIVYTGLGENDRAIQLLQASYAAKDPLLQYILVEAHFEPIRNDPRFQDLAIKIGLPR